MARPEASRERPTLSPRVTRHPPLEKEIATGQDTEKTSGLVPPGYVQALTPSEQRVLEELKQRDREVRAHEQAHLLAAGGLALGPPRFTYQIGPDGKRYAVSGEVPIDTSAVPGNPQATIQKAARLRRAALAPLHPSATDLAIAMKAAAMMAEAQRELLQQQHVRQAVTQGLSTTPTPSGTEDASASATPKLDGAPLIAALLQQYAAPITAGASFQVTV